MLYMIRELYQHHFWANSQVLACVTALSSAQFSQPLSYSVGSVHQQLFHVAYWEHYWFSTLQRGAALPTEAHLNTDDYPDIPSIQYLYGMNQNLVDSVLEGLSEGDLERTLTIERRGQVREFTTWRILFQMYGHALDHRAQILSALHNFGAPTCEQTYMFYIVERDRT